MAYVTDKICGTEPIDPFLHPLDAILADIAIAVQLPPGLYAKACDRYEAIRTFAEREGSPLRGHILRFYAHGSMAIDATTSTRGTDDEYDLDIVAELAVGPDAPPDTVLDLLFRSIEGYPTSQKVIRQTRCVTVRYADKMHLDITPAARLPNGAERESHIFHANPAESPRLHFHVPMNAYGFALWYRGRTPQERWFAHAFDERLRKAYSYEIHADAEVDDVPGQVPLFIKSVTTVALQLLKRFRNVAYASSDGRIPPSAMIVLVRGPCRAARSVLVGNGDPPGAPDRIVHSPGRRAAGENHDRQSHFPEGLLHRPVAGEPVAAGRIRCQAHRACRAP